jgi:hypothetical protein
VATFVIVRFVDTGLTIGSPPAASPRTRSAATYGEKEPPAPRLQSDPRGDLAALRAARDGAARGLRVDRQAGRPSAHPGRSRDGARRRGRQAMRVLATVLAIALAAAAARAEDRPAQLRDVAFDQQPGRPRPARRPVPRRGRQDRHAPGLRRQADAARARLLHVPDALHARAERRREHARGVAVRRRARSSPSSRSASIRRTIPRRPPRRRRRTSASTAAAAPRAAGTS